MRWFEDLGFEDFQDNYCNGELVGITYFRKTPMSITPTSNSKITGFVPLKRFFGTLNRMEPDGSESAPRCGTHVWPLTFGANWFNHLENGQSTVICHRQKITSIVPLIISRTAELVPRSLPSKYEVINCSINNIPQPFWVGRVGEGRSCKLGVGSCSGSGAC